MNDLNCLVVCDEKPLAAWILRALQASELELSKTETVSASAAFTTAASNGSPWHIVFVVCSSALDATLSLVGRLRGAWDGATIVALGRAHSAGEILRFIRAGVNDYIDLSAPSSAQEELAAWQHVFMPAGETHVAERGT